MKSKLRFLAMVIAMTVAASALFSGQAFAADSAQSESGAIASIGEVEYADLAGLMAAVNAAGSEPVTIKFLQSFQLPMALQILENQDLTLDLNGQTITANVDQYMIRNNGKLTVTGNGTVYNTCVEKQGCGVIFNDTTGSLIIENGTFGSSVTRGNAIRNHGEANLKGGHYTACDNYTNGGYAYAIANSTGTVTLGNNVSVSGKMNGAIAADGGDLIVNGGTYSLGDGTIASLFHMIYTSGAGNVKVNGGTFVRNATTDNGFINSAKNSTGKVIISSGTFEDAYNNHIKFAGLSNVEVAGGTFKGAIVKEDTASLSITGGAFPDADVSEYIEGNFKQDKNGNIVPEESKAAKIGDVYYPTLEAALEAAKSGDTIILLDGVHDLNKAALNIDKSVTVKSENPKGVEIKNAHFVPKADIAFEGAVFTEDSYVNITNASSLTMTNCDVNVNLAQKLTGRAAFIVGTAETASGVKLSLKDNKFIVKSAADSYAAAIFTWSYLADGSVISGNKFGDADNRYTFIAVKTLNAKNGAVIRLENNEVYGTNKNFYFFAFDLYQNNSRANQYTVLSKNNVIDAENVSSYPIYAFYIEVNDLNGQCGNALVLDNGSTLNSAALTLKDFGCDTDSGNNKDKACVNYGINAALDNNDKIIGGSFGKEILENAEYIAEGMVPVKNDDGSYTVGMASDVVLTDAGASAIVTEEGKGTIRFITKAESINGAVKSFGTYMIPLTLFDGAWDSHVTVEYTQDINEGETFAADLTDIPESELDTEIYARSFMFLDGVKNPVIVQLAPASVNSVR